MSIKQQNDQIEYDPEGTSGFDQRMVRINAGDTLEENKPKQMTDEDFKKRFGFSPKTTRNANGGRKRRKQTKRIRSTKRRRSSKRSRSLKRRK